MDPTDNEQDHGNDGNERTGCSPTTQIGAMPMSAKKGKGKPKVVETSTIQGNSGIQPGGTRNLRSNGITIRAIRDQLERASGPLADRIAEARELLDPDLNAGDKPQSAVCLSAMERGLREMVDIFKGHFDRGLAAIGDEPPELHDYLYDAFTVPLPAATRCLGLRSHPPPAELLQIAMEHLADLRTVRRTLEDVEKLSQLSFGTRSGTGDSQPAGDGPAARRTPPPQQVHDPTDHQSDEWLFGQFPRRFEQLKIQEERRAVTPVMRSVARVAQNPVVNAEGAGANTREWVNQTSDRRERTLSPRIRQAGNQLRPPVPDHSIAGNPNPCSRFRTTGQVRGRDPSALRTVRHDEGTTAFETVRLQPPTFSGKPEDWTTFWSYFKRAVDDKSIPGFEKQLLLLRCLKEGSPARRAVEVYPPSDGNYPVVIKLLKERFGDTDDLQRAIRAQLLHLPPARENVQSLTTVVDEFERGVCQLEQLGANVEDASFGPLLESKLPVRILTELRIRESTSGTKWSVREFRRAVGAQVRCMRAAESALAAMREPERRTESRPEPDRHARGARNRDQFPRAFMVGGNPSVQRPATPPGASAPRTGTHTPNRKANDQNWNRNHRPPRSRGEVPADNACSLCQKPGHRPSSCSAYPTAQTRRQRLVEQRRCLRCLSSDHIASCCPRPRACRWCQRDDHHSLVCWVGSGTQLATREPPAGMESGGRDKHKPVANAMLVQTGLNSESDSRPPEACTKTKRKPKRRANDQANQSEKQGERSPGTDQRAFTAMGESLPAYLMVCPVVAANDDITRQRRTALLLDPGSQVDWAQTILTEQLELPNAGSVPLVVQVFGGSKKRVPSTKHRLKLKRLDGGWEQLEVSSVPYVCTPIQTKLVGPGTHPGLLKPVDATLQPQIVIGIRKFWDFVIGFKKSAAGVFLIDTVFGTVLCGEHFGAHLGQSAPHNHILMAITDEDNGWNRMPPPSAVEQFWSLETIGIRDDPTGDADTEAIIQFEKSVRQKEDGRYSIRLPWRDPIPALPSNFTVAYRRLTSLINRLQRMPDVLERYRAVIEEQFSTGIIEEATIGASQREHFIPHQAVITPKKLRIVYDASAHTKGAPSLNDCLLRGPVWLPDLAGMLLRFRACQVPVIADVEKAFLMVEIEEADREVCKFLWVRDPTRPVTTDNLMPLRFRRLAFGLTPSPFCLAAVVRHHLRKYGSDFAEQLIRDTYVDNVLIPADTREEAVEKASLAKQMFTGARMNLREFLSNDQDLNREFPTNDYLGKTTAKMLGLEWNSERDEIRMNYPGIPPDCAATNSRRSVLKTIASLFDPLGTLAPATLAAKRFFQRLWDATHDWDSPLNPTDQREWERITANWDGEVTLIPRKVITGTGLSLSLHVFTDASESAYAAAVYVRSEGPDGTSSRLLMAKSRLKPKKAADTFTIPRMELMGILLGVRLAAFVHTQLHRPIAEQHLWSDSMIALHWVRNHTPQPQFVANRLLEIRTATDITFHHVRSEDNSADIATRGMPPAELQSSQLWWKGPWWIVSPADEWPKELEFKVDREGTEFPLDQDIPSAMLLTSTQDDSFPTTFLRKCGQWKRAVRVIAWSLRFVRKARKGGTNEARIEKEGKRDPLCTEELNAAQKTIIRSAQNEGKMPQGIQTEVDEDGTKRLHSRVENCAETELSRPIVLPKHSRIGILLIADTHEGLCHSGINATLSQFLKGYWTPGARQQARKVIKSCRRCRRMEAAPYALPPMPPLPADRVRRRLPFESVGLDFLGPTAALDESGQRRKAWVLLITCLTTRAIYVDATRDLPADSLITLLRRFIARRGAPSRILSDNAPSFTLVGRTLSSFGITGNDPVAFTDSRGIKWRFTPSHTPWAGGVFERAVQSVKRALQKTLGSSVISYDELITLLAEVEAAVNSRPLTYVSDGAGDPLPVRPIDFIQENGRLGIDPLNPASELPPDRKDPPHVQLEKRWRAVQQRTEHFWRRWHSEYLLQLREKAGWQHRNRRVVAGGTPKVGDVVLVEDKMQPRNVWQMGRITELRGPPDQIRSVLIRMPNGRIWGRPVNKICPLEESPESDRDGTTEMGKNDDIMGDLIPPGPIMEQIEPQVEGNDGPTHQEADTMDESVPASAEEPAEIIGQSGQGKEEAQVERENNPVALRRSRRGRKIREIRDPEWSMPRKPQKRKFGQSRIVLTLLAVLMWTGTVVGCQPAPRNSRLTALRDPNDLKNPCELSCAARGVTVYSDESVDKLEICCADGCWATSPKNPETHYELPVELLIHGYNCTSSCWVGKSSPRSAARHCAPKSECDLMQCLLCWEQLANPKCNPRWSSALFGIGMAAVLALCGCLWPMISRCLLGASLLWKVMAWVTRYPIRVFNRLAGRDIPEPTADQVKSRVRKGARKARAEIRDVQERLQLARRARAAARAWRNPERGRAFMPGVATALLPLLCCVAISSASKPISVMLRSEDCARTPSGLKCSGSAATILTLLPSDQVNSFLIRSAQDELLGAVRLRLTSITMVCVPKTEKWLRSYTVSTVAIKRCPAAGSCHGDYCARVRNGAKVPELMELNNRPGHSACIQSTSFWHNSCGLPSAACLFYRWAATPTTSTLFEEFSCLEWDLQLSAWVELETNSGQVESQRVVIHPGIPEQWGNMTLAVVPSSLPPLPVLSSFFITDGRAVAMGKTIPSDLHCTDEQQARGFDQCQLSIGACQKCAPDHDNGSVHCHCRDVNIEQYMANPESRLPLDVARLHIHHRGPQVRAEFQYTPVQVHVQLNGVELLSEYSNTRCWVTSPKLEGCYRCVSGATVEATCRTDHGTALAKVKCADGTMFAMHCGGNGTTTTESVPFDRAEVFTECQVRCPAGSTKFRLKGELAFIPRQLQFGFGHRDSIGGQLEQGGGIRLPEWGMDPFPLFRMLIGGPWILMAIGAGAVGLIAIYFYVKFNPAFRLYRSLITVIILLMLAGVGEGGQVQPNTGFDNSAGAQAPFAFIPIGGILVLCLALIRFTIPRRHPALIIFPPSPLVFSIFLLSPLWHGILCRTGDQSANGEPPERGGGATAPGAPPLQRLFNPPIQRRISFPSTFTPHSLSYFHSLCEPRMTDDFANGGFSDCNDDFGGDGGGDFSPRARSGRGAQRRRSLSNNSEPGARGRPMARCKSLGRPKPLPPKSERRCVADDVNLFAGEDWGDDPWQRVEVERFLREQEARGKRMIHERTGEQVPFPSTLGLLPASRQEMAPGWTVADYFAETRCRSLKWPQWPCIYSPGGVIGSSKRSRTLQRKGHVPWRLGQTHCDWHPLEELWWTTQSELDSECDGAPMARERARVDSTGRVAQPAGRWGISPPNWPTKGVPHRIDAINNGRPPRPSHSIWGRSPSPRPVSPPKHLPPTEDTIHSHHFHRHQTFSHQGTFPSDRSELAFSKTPSLLRSYSSSSSFCSFSTSSSKMYRSRDTERSSGRTARRLRLLELTAAELARGEFDHNRMVQQHGGNADRVLAAADHLTELRGKFSRNWSKCHDIPGKDRLRHRFDVDRWLVVAPSNAGENGGQGGGQSRGKMRSVVVVVPPTPPPVGGSTPGTVEKKHPPDITKKGLVP